MKKKNKYKENPEPKRKYEKTNMRKILKIRPGPYFICAVCHWCLYKLSVRLSEHEKHHILSAELYCPVQTFDEKTVRNEIPLQPFFNKMSLDLIPDKLKDF